MSIRHCSGCAGLLATDAQFCEHCGRPVPPPVVEPVLSENTTFPPSAPSDREVPWWTTGTTPLPASSLPVAITETAAPIVPAPISTTAPERRVPRPRSALLILAIGVVGGLAAWGWSQKSNAAAWRANATRWESRASTLKSELADSTEKVNSLNDQVSSLASEKARVADERQQLRQIVSTVPTVTGGLRNCASSALTVATDSLDYATSFPYGDSYTLNSDVDATTTICSSAVDAADTLDGIVSGLTQ